MGSLATQPVQVRQFQSNQLSAYFAHYFSVTNFFSLYVSSNAKSAPAADTTLSTFVDPFKPNGRPGAGKEKWRGRRIRESGGEGEGEKNRGEIWKSDEG